jgi:hypothetical protein
VGCAEQMKKQGEGTFLILKKAVARNGATTQRLKTKTYED